MQGPLVYNPEAPGSSFSFGGLIESLDNPGRLHLGDLTLRANIVGTHELTVNINSLSTRSITATDVGSKVGLTSSSTPHAIVVKSARRSVEDIFFPIETRSKRSNHLTLGDINGDSVFDLNDAQFLQLRLIELLVNSTALSEEQLALSDLDLNGDINTNDVTYLIKVNFGLLPFLSHFLLRPIDDPFSDCVLRVSLSATDRDGFPVTDNLAIYALFLSTDANFHTEYDIMTLNYGEKVTTQLGNPSDGKWVLLGTNPNVTGGYILQTHLNNITSTDIGLAFHIDYKPDMISSTIFLSGIQSANSQLYPFISDTIIPLSPFSTTTIDQSIEFTPLRIFDNTIKEYECFNYFEPVFGFGTYEVSQTLPEDHPIYSVIVTVSATDEDTNINGVIEYSIYQITYVPVAGMIAEVDPVAVGISNGTLYVTSELDRDAYSRLSVYIYAIDQGPHISSRRTATTVVQIISLADVNDNAPVISGDLVFEIPENSGFGAVVGTLIGTDIDATPPNNVVFFSVKGSADPFTVSTSGVISVNKLIDGDNGNPTQYTYTIVASDSALTNRRTSETNITINIIDVNDIAPEFLPPFYIDVSESSLAGTVIGTIQARDNDTSFINAQFLFSISSVKPLDADKNVVNQQLLSDGIFSINITDGTLTLEQVRYNITKLNWVYLCSNESPLFPIVSLGHDLFKQSPLFISIFD